MATKEQLLAASYEESAANRGPTADKFEELLYSPHGHQLLWWKAYSAPPGAVGPNGELRQENGRIYVQQTLADDVRCLIYRTQRTLTDAEFGTYEAGSTAIAVLPHQVELARLDRVALSGVSWIRRQFVKRGNDDTDALTNVPVVSIESVFTQGGVAFNSDAYAIAADGRGIRWASGGPDAGVFYYLEHRQQVQWEYQMDEQAAVQLGPDGSRLPQRGIIRLCLPGEV